MASGCLCHLQVARLWKLGEEEKAGLVADVVAAMKSAAGEAETPLGPVESVIFHGGPIYTMNPADPRPEAVWIRDRKVQATGRLADVEARAGEGARRLDLGGRCLMPGLFEAHLHVLPSALTADWLDLGPIGPEPPQDLNRAYSWDGVRTLLENAVAATPKGEWIVGRLVDPSLMAVWTDPTKDLLDAISTDHPMFLINASGHLAYVNSLAFERAGIDDSTPNPTGGTFSRQDGKLTGLLLEEPAFRPFFGGLSDLLPGKGKLIPPPTPERIAANVQALFRLAASRGATFLMDAMTGAGLGAAEVDLYRLWMAAGRAPVRLAGALYGNDPDTLDKWLKTYRPQADAEGFFTPAIKLTSDGSNQGLTGYQLTPYRKQDPLMGVPDVGVFNFDPVSTFQAQMAQAIGAGWPLMVHANGDQAIGIVLDAYEAVLGAATGGPGLAKRHRIEHCSLLHDDRLQQLIDLGISPSFLIGHVAYWGMTFRDQVLGADRAMLLDRCASVLAQGARITLHSDYTVSPVGPLRLMENAVDRVMYASPDGEVLNPAERIDLDAAMRAVTIDAAWQCHADGLTGSLEPGKAADITVLAEDPHDWTAAGKALRNLPVACTYVGGRLAYRNDAEAFPPQG